MTIEDVAAMTEDALRSYGIGGRELREKAREWLTGKDSATAENERLKAELEALKERLNALESGEPKKRGPKPKDHGRNEETTTD
jgi:predicted nuclease with TOPRIM domain